MTEPPTKSPWTVALDKIGGLVIEAIDQATAEIQRRANTPPPNVVPIRPDHQAMEIEGLKIEVKELQTEINRLCLLADCAIEILGPVEGVPAWRARDNLREITSSPHRKGTAT